MIEHFFKTIGNCDGFGPKVIEKLCANGISNVSDIYLLDMEGFITACVKAGISAGIVSNLYIALSDSQKIEIEDWRFLAAFGIPNFGPASCEKLLQKYPLGMIFDATVKGLLSIDGIGVKTAEAVFAGLCNISDEFRVLAPKFNLKFTPIGETATGKLAGKTICFTGTMPRNRKEMEAEAKKLGATITSSVSKKTDYLVCGENVGAAKTSAAEKNGVRVLSEAEYVELIGG